MWYVNVITIKLLFKNEVGEGNMNVNEASMICVRQILTQLKTKNNCMGQLPSTLKKESELSDLPGHEHNKQNKGALNVCLLSGPELNILNELSHLTFVSTLKSCEYFLHFL